MVRYGCVTVLLDYVLGRITRACWIPSTCILYMYLEFNKLCWAITITMFYYFYSGVSPLTNKGCHKKCLVKFMELKQNISSTITVLHFHFESNQARQPTNACRMRINGLFPWIFRPFNFHGSYFLIIKSVKY